MRSSVPRRSSSLRPSCSSTKPQHAAAGLRPPHYFKAGRLREGVITKSNQGRKVTGRRLGLSHLYALGGPKEREDRRPPVRRGAQAHPHAHPHRIYAVRQSTSDSVKPYGKRKSPPSP
eukprot:scaffold85451_cov38-Phaeocystis_antarctica.AAC.2